MGNLENKLYNQLIELKELFNTLLSEVISLKSKQNSNSKEIESLTEKVTLIEKRINSTLSALNSITKNKERNENTTPFLNKWTFTLSILLVLFLKDIFIWISHLLKLILINITE